MGSSSKRKSAKKKSSKLSSQARKMKKSGRTKSKKLGRRHDSSTDDSMSSASISRSISSPGNDSYTSNSDDDSMSSASISRSSSEDTYRRRKNKSRSRGKLKKTRKRARRRSSSRDNRKKLAPMKKRKRSRKDSDSKTRKKYGRKKRRRDSSASPTSSDSHSCSTCKGGNSDSEESERESIRSRPRENKRDLSKDKRRTKLSFRRSPSHSSHSRSKDQSGSVSYSEEKFLNENNTRRLRSVITFVEQRSEAGGNEWKKDLQNEEIVYDNDDYPSRSSSGGGSKKESTSRSPIAFDVEKWTESPKFVSEHEVTELSGSVNDAHDMNEFATRSSAKENGNYTPLVGAGSGGDDLEAILRQKALQNLNKFRGGHKSNTKPTSDQKNKDDGNVNASSTSKAAVERVVLDSGHTEKFYGIVKQNIDHPADGSGLSGNPKEDGLNSGNPVVGKSVSGTSPFRGRSSGLDMRHQATASGASPDEILREIKSEGKTTATVQTTSVAGNSSFWESSSGLDTPNKTTTSVASREKNLMETESDRKTELKITQPLSPSVGINKGSACSSATVEPALSATSGGQSLNNQKDEAKDGGQYQQKTMSVMRGGEMVQVNYKVYIPQRAPAIARRQLKR